MISKERIKEWLLENCSYLLGTQYEKVIHDCIQDLGPRREYIDWVPVSEALPIDGQEVICYDPARLVVCHARWDGANDYFFIYDSTGDNESRCFSHWYPINLPEPPK